MAEITCGTGSGNFPQPGDPDLNNSILNAVPAFGGIDVTWTYPELLPEAVAHVRLYRSTNADPATAVLLRRVSGEFYYDKLDPLQGVTYYYWIEIVSVNGTIGDLIGPASAMARPTIEQTIEMLSGQINDSHLAQSLRDNIQRIDMVSSDLEAETAARFAQYDGLQSDLAAYQQDVDGVATLLASEVNRLDDADTAQISQINVLGAKTDDNAAQIVSEAETRATADEALAKDYEVLKASSANVYYQSTAPDPAVVSLQEHGIWVDTTEPGDGSEPAYDQYQWDGSQWVPTTADTLAGVHAAIEADRLARTNRDGALAQDVQTLEASVGRKSRTYFQANPPVAENIGDLWIDTDNNNALYYWTGSEWVDAWDRRIVEALQDVADAQQSALDAMSAAEQAQATADGAIRTYYQAAAPTGLNSTTDVGDLWFDTDDDQAYRWNGSTWKIIEDNTISKALAAAEGAQATADGKITTFRQSTQPTAEGVGDMWIHTGNKNRLYLWTGSQWADARDSDISVGVSRNQVFRQATAPSASNPGDLWFDSDNDDKGYRWTGSAWEPLNLYTGNQVTAAIQDFKQSQVGYCMINGSPDRNRTNKSDCESAGGTWLDMHAIANVVKGVQITDGDNQTANVEQRMRSYKNDIGQLLSEYTVKVQTDTNGNKIVGGFGLTADGATVEAGFDVDRFWVGKLGNKRFPFIIDANTNEVFMDEAAIRHLTFTKLRDEAGNFMVVNGKLKAKYIEAGDLISQSTVTVGPTTGKTFAFNVDGSYKLLAKRTSETGQGGVVYDEDGISVYDEAGTLRVKIGKLL